MLSGHTVLHSDSDRNRAGRRGLAGGPVRVRLHGRDANGGWLLATASRGDAYPGGGAIYYLANGLNQIGVV